jgi:hypothetical protein
MLIGKMCWWSLATRIKFVSGHTSVSLSFQQELLGYQRRRINGARLKT